MSRSTLVLLPLFFLFLKNSAAQTHFFSGNIDHFATSRKVDGYINLGGRAYIFPTVEKGWKLPQNSWLGIRAGFGRSGLWLRNFSQGFRTTTFQIGSFYRKDRKIVEKFNAFGRIGLDFEQIHDEFFSTPNTIFHTKTWSIGVSANVGADFFFKKNWAITASLGNGAIDFVHEKKDLTSGVRTLNGVEAALDFTTLIYSAGLRYFW